MRHSQTFHWQRTLENFFFGGLYILYPQYHSILVEEGEYGEIFFGFCLKKRHILTKFELMQKVFGTWPKSA